MTAVAALFVDSGGIYSTLDGVECWGVERDARTYAGPHPVVAHPPCTRWCRLAGLVEARWGHRRGEDDGCFASALQSVRSWGGVLEHPAYTAAWPAYGLPAPHAEAWQRTLCGGWVCHVEQGRYGHAAKKATWLYGYGIEPSSLQWGRVSDAQASSLVSWCRNYNPHDTRRRIGRKEASATPRAFAELLVSLARSTGGLR